MPGRAEAALQAVVLVEGLLHRMQLAVVGEPLDGDHRRAVGLDGEHGAGLHRLAVDMDDAGAALRGVAADMRSGQAERLAEQMDQQRPVLDVGGYGLPVDGHGYGSHSLSSLADGRWRTRSRRSSGF